MRKLIIALLLCSVSQLALAIDVKQACKEREEQKNALFSRMSTSIKEAMLAGQCSGYEQTAYNYNNQYSFPELPLACSEFVEQKKALLPLDISISLREANLAGMCIGAIYKVAKDCRFEEYRIDYDGIANVVRNQSKRQAVYKVAESIDCR